MLIKELLNHFNINIMDRIVRRKFLKSIFASIFLLAGWLLNKTVEKHTQIKSSNKRIIMSNNISNGITFYENLIIIKENETIKILSALCTHLGCRINRVHGSELVCPCHGSRYDFDGKVLKGPSQNPLLLLRFKRDKDKIIIYES